MHSALALELQPYVRLLEIVVRDVENTPQGAVSIVVSATAKRMLVTAIVATSQHLLSDQTVLCGATDYNCGFSQAFWLIQSGETGRYV